MFEMTVDNIKNSLSGFQLADHSVKEDYYGRFHNGCDSNLMCLNKNFKLI